MGGGGVTSTAHDVRQTGAELVREKRVQQRVETAVEVVDDERDRGDDELPVGGVFERVAERLPEHAHVIRQHADGERYHDRDEQTNNFASADQSSLVCTAANRCDAPAPCIVTSRK